MARHARYGIDYFNIDCTQEDNLNYLEAKHGLLGYGLIVKLWRKIYMINGYYADFSERYRTLFCKEVGVDPDFLMEVLETCFAEELFSREMFQNYGILTGSGVQKRWLKIAKDAKRKNCTVDEKYLVIEKTPEKSEFPPEEIPITPGQSTQSKIKKNKEKENKEKNVSAPAAPAPPRVGKEKKKTKAEPEPEPHWQQLVKVWFDFGTEKYAQEPSFARDDPKVLKRIIGRLKERAAKKGLEWAEETAVTRFRTFLDAAFQDPWLKTKFLLANLEKQFDVIIQDQSRLSKKDPADSPAAKKPGNSMSEQLAYLQERFLENTLQLEFIPPELYDFLVARSYVPIGFMNKTGKPLLDNLKRLAVVEYFKVKKKEVRHEEQSVGAA